MAYNNIKVKERQVLSSEAQAQRLKLAQNAPVKTQSASPTYIARSVPQTNNAQALASRSQSQQLGIVSEVPMNEWNAAVDYEKLNIVTYKGGTFIAKRPNTGIAPLEANNWENVWMPILSGVGLSSVVTEYAIGYLLTNTPPKEGWSTEIPQFTAGQYLWVRTTITFTDGQQNVFYTMGAPISPTKTSELENDGEGSSPFASEDFVNSSINNFAAYYITPTAAGDHAWLSRSSLLSATEFYSGGKMRIPTQNDYAVVQSDESKPRGVDGSYPTTRYSYQGGTYPDGKWSFQYIVNNTTLTDAQIAAINSGITVERLEEDEAHINATANMAEVAKDLAATATELATAAAASAETANQAVATETARAQKAETANAALANAAQETADTAQKAVVAESERAQKAEQDEQARAEAAEKANASAAATAQSTAEAAKNAVDAEVTRAKKAEEVNAQAAKNAASAASAAQSTADGAQKAAETAQGAATKAQSTADSALTAANSAQSTADSAAASAKSAGQTANSALGRANVSVRYDADQGLTADQKAQARSNIGAGASSFSGNYDDLNNKPSVVLYTSQSLSTAQQAQARKNIGAGTGSSDFNGDYNSLTNKPKAVLYSAQSLTEDEKAQARSNIGAGDSQFSGDYNDLKNKPNIPSAYTLKLATPTELGGIKIGASVTGKDYAVKLNDNGQAYVSVPWTDNDTKYSQATASTLGLVKIGATGLAEKNYPIQLNANGQMYVSVPWTDTQSDLSSYAKKTDLNAYLPKTGGTVTGGLTVNGVLKGASYFVLDVNNASSYNEGLRINSDTGWAIVGLGNAKGTTEGEVHPSDSIHAYGIARPNSEDCLVLYQQGNQTTDSKRVRINNDGTLYMQGKKVAVEEQVQTAQTRANASVRYDIAQGLTADQQAQARSNIGAGASSFSGNYNDLSNKPAAVLYTAQNLTATQMSQARTNLGLGTLATKSSIYSSDIANGTIINSNISSAAAISASKIYGLAAVATSGKYSDLTGTPSAYTLPKASNTALGGVYYFKSTSDDNCTLRIAVSTTTSVQIYGKTESVASGTGLRTINFPRKFYAIPIVLLTCAGSGGSTDGTWLQALKVSSVTLTSFTWSKQFSEAGYISWIAIGEGTM